MKIATSHRGILRTSQRDGEDARAQVRLLLALALLSFCILHSSFSSLVTGNVVDVGLNSLTTTMKFTPTNSVLVTGGGLSAGPATNIVTTNGSFSVVLDAGDYWVSFPLVPWRKSFIVHVPAGQTNNITNWVDAAIGPYTNTLATDSGVTILFTP